MRLHVIECRSVIRIQPQAILDDFCFPVLLPITIDGRLDGRLDLLFAKLFFALLAHVRGQLLLLLVENVVLDLRCLVGSALQVNISEFHIQLLGVRGI